MSLPFSAEKPFANHESTAPVNILCIRCKSAALTAVHTLIRKRARCHNPPIRLVLPVPHVVLMLPIHEPKMKAERIVHRGNWPPSLYSELLAALVYQESRIGIPSRTDVGLLFPLQAQTVEHTNRTFCAGSIPSTPPPADPLPAARAAGPAAPPPPPQHSPSSAARWRRSWGGPGPGGS